MRTLIVEADGASRGNPGAASYGAVVRDESSGELLAEVAEALGTATNNVAEYRGLIAGLEAAAGIDPAARVEVRMDSKLVVEQMSGRWQVKHPDLKPLAARALAILPGERVAYVWVPRSQNKHADRLANQALDAAAKGEIWTSPTPDPELTAQGQDQAQRAAARLRSDVRFGPIDVVLASPLRRTTATAEAVAKAVGLDVTPEPGFRELDFGRLEGLSFAEADAQYPAELAAFLASPDVPPPDGETLTALAARVGAARDRTLGRYHRKTVLVATHVTPIKVLVCDALGAPLSAVNRMELSPASLTVIDFYEDGLASVRCVNDVAHLG